MINPILEVAIQNSELWNLKPEFRNQKSEIRNRKSQSLKIWNPQSRNQKSKSLISRNATCDIKFWQSRCILVCDVIISNVETVKWSTFSLLGWVEKFYCYFRYRFSQRGRGEYLLTSCATNFSGKRGRGWGGVNVGRQFPASFRKYFEMNWIFSVASVYYDKTSTIRG